MKISLSLLNPNRNSVPLADTRHLGEGLSRGLGSRCFRNAVSPVARTRAGLDLLERSAHSSYSFVLTDFLLSMNFYTYFFSYLEMHGFQKKNNVLLFKSGTKCHSQSFQTEVFTEAFSEMPREKLGSTRLSPTVAVRSRRSLAGSPRRKKSPTNEVKQHLDPESPSCLLGDGIKEHFTLPKFLPR